MYLHDNKEIFRELIEQVSEETGKSVVVIEKDYYVTIILRLLSKELPNVVFKGGTSLSKGFKVINRFSEDIDITFDEHIGESRRRKLKYSVLKGISETLNMPITNWDSTQSDRDYNAYYFAYESVFGLQDDRMPFSIKLETALGLYAFPTEKVMIGSYLGDLFKKKKRFDLASQYMLDEFEMKLQSINRTYIDKIFALSDYYMQGKSKRYSRHLYDIYKLKDRVEINQEFKKLFFEIREHRRKTTICPSAQEGISISNVIREFCNNNFFKEDYHEITSYFSEDYVEYEDTVKQMMMLSDMIESFEK